MESVFNRFFTKKQKNLLSIMALLDELEEEKMKEMKLRSTLSKLYKELNPDMSKFPLLKKITKLQKEALQFIERSKKTDFKSQQAFAEYENYNLAVDRLFRYFRHDCSNPRIKTNLSILLKKQRDINQLLECSVELLNVDKKP